MSSGTWSADAGEGRKESVRQWTEREREVGVDGRQGQSQPQGYSAGEGYRGGEVNKGYAGEVKRDVQADGNDLDVEEEGVRDYLVWSEGLGIDE